MLNLVGRPAILEDNFIHRDGEIQCIVLSATQSQQWSPPTLSHAITGKRESINWLVVLQGVCMGLTDVM